MIIYHSGADPIQTRPTTRFADAIHLNRLAVLLALVIPGHLHAEETAEVSVNNTSFVKGVMDVSLGLAFSTAEEKERKGGTSATGIIRIWDLSTGLPFNEIAFPARIFDIKIDRATHRLAVLGGPGNHEDTEPFAAVYDYAGHRTLFVTPPGLVQSRSLAMTFGPDGNSLWLGPGPEADEYEVNEPAFALTWGEQNDVRTSPISRPDFLNLFAGNVTQIPSQLSSFEVMDLDQDMALMAHRSEESAEVWNAETGETLFSIGHRANPINGYLLSASGRNLMAWQGSGGQVESLYLWDFQSMEYRIISQFPEILKDRSAPSLGLSTDGNFVGLVAEELQADDQLPPRFTLYKLSLSETSAEVDEAISGLDKVLWDATGHSAIIWQGESVSEYDLDSGQVTPLQGGMDLNTVSVSPDRRYFWRTFQKESADPGPTDQGVELVDIGSGEGVVLLPSQAAYFTQNIKVDYAGDGMLVGSECKVASGGYTHSELKWVSYQGEVRDFAISEPEDAMLIWCEVIEIGGHRMACAARSNGVVQVFDLLSGEMLSSRKDPQIEGWFQNLSMQATTRSEGWAILPREDGGIRFIQLAASGEFELKADLLISDENSWLLRSGDGYYWTSPNGDRNVFITRAGVSSPIDFLDIAFHRPHEVARHFGAAAEVIEDLESSWRARLRRHGLSEETLPNLDQVPRVRCDIPVPLAGDNPVWLAELGFEGITDPAARLHILVNGVPIYGMSGTPLGGALDSTSLPVTLTCGINELDVFVREASGLESMHWRGRTWLREPVSVVVEKPRLHLLAVGVSDYLDDAFELEFAAKDARDLADGFKTMGPQNGFGEVIATLVLDQNATRTGILEAGQALANARPDDTIMVYFAGHGIVDEKGDYFFGTHDLDPNRPEEKGLSYQSIQSLFEGVSARKRLLFLDTCHAGELEEAELTDLTEKLSLASRGVRVNFHRSAGATGFKRPNRLLRDMFSDLRVDTGAHVLCAAQGAEFALESGEIGNGLFTHFLLQEVLTGHADLDTDGQILAPELINAVASEVSGLTRGEQNPVLRESNRSYQFPLWPASRRHQQPREFFDTYFQLSQNAGVTSNRERVLNLFAPSVTYFGDTFGRDQIDADIRDYFTRFYGVSYEIGDLTETRSGESPQVVYRYTLNYQAYSAVANPGEQFAEVKQHEGALPSRMTIEPHEFSWRITEIALEK